MTEAPTTTHQFTAGQIVTATSPCDSECVWTFEVTGRTAAFVTLTDTDTGDVRRAKITTVESTRWNGSDVERFTEETALPFGRFSMAPVVRAERTAAVA
jgi:hypothetical protein